MKFEFTTSGPFTMLAVSSSSFELVGSISSSNIFNYKICDRLHEIPQDYLDGAQLCMNALQSSPHQEFVVLTANPRFYAPNTPNINLLPAVRISKSTRRYDLRSQFSGFSQCLGHKPPFMIFIEMPACDDVPRHHDIIFSKVQCPEIRDFQGSCFVQSADPSIWMPQAIPVCIADSTSTSIQLLTTQSPALQPAVLQIALCTPMPAPAAFSTALTNNTN